MSYDCVVLGIFSLLPINCIVWMGLLLESEQLGMEYLGVDGWMMSFA